MVIGSPGAGKGTQVNLLSEKLGFYHFKTSAIVGRIIEEADPGSFVEIEGDKYYFEEQKKLRADGKLWDDAFVTYFTNEKVKELHGEGKNIIFDGYPRTLYEAKHTIPILKDLYGKDNVEFLYIEISEEEAIFRNTHRRECELMRHPVLYSEENSKLTKCQIDGSDLVERKDDDSEIIKVRLGEFREKTMSILSVVEEENIKIHNINGSPAPVKVFENVLKAIE